MPKFMLPETALARLAEDDNAPVGARVQALKQLTHPPLCLLRRLLHRSRTTDTSRAPVPSRLLAVAALKYAREVALRKGRPVRPPKLAQASQGSNALGI